MFESVELNVFDFAADCFDVKGSDQLPYVAVCDQPNSKYFGVPCSRTVHCSCGDGGSFSP